MRYILRYRKIKISNVYISINLGDDKYIKYGCDLDIIGDIIYKLKGEICFIIIVLKIVVFK